MPNGPPEPAHPPEQGEKREGALARLLSYRPLVASLLYVQATSVGVIYLWALFGEFGINVFQFSEPTDFLLAAFREPLTVLLATLAVTIGSGVVWVAQRAVGKLAPGDRTALDVLGVRVVFALLPAIVVLLVTLLVPHWMGKGTALRIREGRGVRVVVKLNSPSAVGESETREQVLVGRIGSFLAVFEKEGEMVSLVRIDNIDRVNIVPRDGPLS